MAPNSCTSDSMMAGWSTIKIPWYAFTKILLEVPATDTVNKLCHKSKFREEYNCTAFRFESHTFAKPPYNGDEGESGYGMFRKMGSTQWHRAFMYTYLPREDIPTEYLSEALKNRRLIPEVMSRGNPTSPREIAEKKIVSALLPVVNAMLSEGCSDGVVCAGVTFVRLYIDMTQPEPLFYYPQVPDLMESRDKNFRQAAYLANFRQAAYLANFCLIAISRAQANDSAHTRN